ncbi:hypothetical protein O181_002526 [Austropuccinia psidii MF-1]|uniref:Uncharacterized protein n=1 Tax=Austropuccinia psidii MF-1 TaxID=1389203 RepID=A0A9Q3BC32_9BASI|nr:hypothetical protein [Austropuccinia psidii MF-1]
MIILILKKLIILRISELFHQSFRLAYHCQLYSSFDGPRGLLIIIRLRTIAVILQNRKITVLDLGFVRIRSKAVDKADIIRTDCVKAILPKCQIEKVFLALKLSKIKEKKTCLITPSIPCRNSLQISIN